ncbi:MAG: hypothetical protein GXP54_10230 [Deltaproteobacteria bacterium]|nr:hypothetical protein [Deltaproteobacteria bacterium]
MSKNLPTFTICFGACAAVIACSAIQGCSGASRGAEVTGPYLHPTLQRPHRPLVALTPMPPPPEKMKPRIDDRSPKPRTAARPAPSMVARDAAGGYRLPPLAANIDIRRSEIVKSVIRLLGVRRSFDDRSFLGHVLKVNDLLPKGAGAATFTAADFLTIARSQGRMTTPSAALPGDIVLFRCVEACGYPPGDPIAAGVVERVYGERLEFIAYVDSRVRRCYSGGKAPRRGTMPVKELVGLVSIGR